LFITIIIFKITRCINLDCINAYQYVYLVKFLYVVNFSFSLKRKAIVRELNLMNFGHLNAQFSDKNLDSVNYLRTHVRPHPAIN